MHLIQPPLEFDLELIQLLAAGLLVSYRIVTDMPINFNHPGRKDDVEQLLNSGLTLQRRQLRLLTSFKLLLLCCDFALDLDELVGILEQRFTIISHV